MKETLVSERWQADRNELLRVTRTPCELLENKNHPGGLMVLGGSLMAVGVRVG